MSVPLFTLLLLATVAAVEVQKPSLQEHHCVGYQLSEPLLIECKNLSGQWSSGPVCSQTGRAIKIEYGVDGFLECGIPLSTRQHYLKLVEWVRGDSALPCRVKIAPDHDIYIPFEIPFWGFIEHTHTHVNVHVNFIFHGDNGRVIGAAAYPVRDQFQAVAEGSTLFTHGPIKWFHRNTFMSFHSTIMDFGNEESIWVAIILWSFITFLFTSIFVGLLCRCLIGPHAPPRTKRKPE